MRYPCSICPVKELKPCGGDNPWCPDYARWLHARVRELEEALEFYADRGHWIADYGCTAHSSKATEDCGEKARAALAKPEGGA